VKNNVVMLAAIMVLLFSCTPQPYPLKIWNEEKILSDDYGVVIFSTSSTLSKEVYNLKIDSEGEQKLSAMLGGTMFPINNKAKLSHYSDHYGHIWVVAIPAGPYSFSMDLANPYKRLVYPNLPLAFNVIQDSVTYIGDISLHPTEAKPLEVFDRFERDKGLIASAAPNILSENIIVRPMIVGEFIKDKSRLELILSQLFLLAH
jgi:hypothetical protein